MPEINLLPAESMARTVAIAQIKRFETPTPNIMFVLGLALLRNLGDIDDAYLP